MPRQLRADLHERVADSLKRGSGGDDELIGHHLEQAYRHRAALARVDERGEALAREAALRLAAAARGALVRGNARASAGLLERAVALLAPGDTLGSSLLLDLGRALFEAGGLADADSALTEALGHAGEHGDVRLAARARVELLFVRLHGGAHGIDEARGAADRAVAALAELGDRAGQCRAWRLRAWIDWTEGHAAAADFAWQRAAEHARAAGDQRELFEILGWRASAAAFGPMPAAEAIRRCDEIRDEVRSSPVAVAVTLRPLGLLHAMTGDFERARRLIRDAGAILDELGRMQSAVSHHEAQVEMLAGEPAIAEQRLRAGYERLAEMGERALLGTTAAMLAQAVYAQGRADDADALCDVSERHCAAEDLVTQAIWRGVRARILAERGALEEAEAVGREGVALVARTDALIEHGDALLALAEVHDRRACPNEARTAVERALRLYERKGATIMAERAHARLRRRPNGGDGAQVGVRQGTEGERPDGAGVGTGASRP
jgi:tetratricopeptide (TPR) repeat protein